MDKRLTSIVIVGLLVAAGLLGYITFKTEVVRGSVLYVGGGGPGNYTNIQDAIDAAIDGDTVYVYSGVYYEDVVVDKTINLTGENRDTTIIDGSGTLDIVSIVANWVNVSGFTVTNGDDDGIELLHVQNCRIFNNTVSSILHRGIWLEGSSWNNIIGNTASNNEKGIRLGGSSWNNVIGNDVSNNDYGISLSWSSWNNINDNIANSNREHGLLLSDSNNNTLINNNASSNDRAGIFLECSIENTLAGNTMIYNGIWIRGDGLEYWNTHDIDTSNTVNGKPVHYWKNRTGGIVPAGAGQVILANCTNVIVEGQDLSYGTISIELGFSSNNTIKDNNISSNNVDGIFICFSNGNTITNNNASSNRQSGLHLRGSNGNNIIRNNANSNYYGFMLGHSSGNNIIVNLVSNNRYGFYLYNDSNTNIITNNLVFSNINIGLLLVDSTGNNIIDNDILKNNWGITLDNSNKNNITNNNGFENTCGLYLDNSNENKVIGNNFSNNLLGILVNHFAEGNNIIGNTVSSNNESGIRIWGFSNGNNVIGNTFSSNNKYGIYLSESSGNNITSNAVLSNIGIGIYLFSSSNNNITNNYVSNNIIGFNLSSSSTNSIYHNNIDNNTNQAYDDRSDNYWDDGYPIGGNHWSDFDEPGEGAYDEHQGPNQDDPASGDGIVDKGIIAGGGKNPYVIDLDSQDNYPLINLVDTLPPIITNLQPPDGSTMNDNTPIISADYSDPSGINVSSVVLIVNGMDVTSFAVVTASGVTYVPMTALPDGIHIIYLEVKDNVDNLAIAMWTFTVDTTPPTITNLQPPDASTTSDYTPMIGADYSDLSGIDVNSVLLEVDGIDVTLLATVTESTVSYIPGMALSEGIHTVYLEVRDIFGNLATATWSFTVVTALPPITNLTTKVVNNGNNVELEWDPSSSLVLDHYLIYRADSAIDFNFTTPYNSSTTWPDPKNNTWVDPDPGVTAVDDDFYYIVRAANFDESDISSTSNTAGVWTKTFQDGVSTFSLPLEPFVKKDSEFYCQDMNASYIKWMNQTTHTWMRHDKGSSQNNTLLEVGEGYEIGFLGKSIQTKYTFTGMPGAMIVYDDNILFSGFDSDSDAKNLTVFVEPNGNVTLTWEEPASMGVGDWYEVYHSNTRDGFFGTLGVHYNLSCPAVNFGNNTTTITGLGANNPGARLYFMVVPFNGSGIRGASTYSIGVWTEEYLNQYDTFGIPLKLSNYKKADWYCDNIPNTVGINYFIQSEQRWGWHSMTMPEGAYDPVLEMTVGYQISTSGPTKFTFIGR